MSNLGRFSDQQLERIIEEATIYMCACPAQVAVALRQLRQLHRYQMGCLQDGDNLSAVHQTIADSTLQAHAELEACLDRVLELEQWDRNTLSMPEGLRKKQFKILDGDDS